MKFRAVASSSHRDEAVQESVVQPRRVPVDLINGLFVLVETVERART